MVTHTQIRNYLERALLEAKKALDLGNYPIGAVFVREDLTEEVVEMNQCSTQNDITAHAEILGIRTLGNSIHKDSPDRYYLFTSLEPCFGCSFYLARTNVSRIYSALKDPHKGGMSDLKPQEQFEKFFAHIDLINEPFADLREESRELMKEYFLRKGRADAAVFYGHSVSNK